MVFFLAGGPSIWVMSAASIFMAGAGGIALGTLDAELFPTEVRCTSNALLGVIGVLGSALGLRRSPGCSRDPLGGLGRVDRALAASASLVAALLSLGAACSPESAGRATARRDVSSA